MVKSHISEIYSNTKKSLNKAEIESFAFEARVLCEHFLSVSINDIISATDIEIDENKLLKLNDAIKKRILGYPLQYLIGEWEFYGYPFLVGEGVLIPRADTETIIEAVKSKKINSPIIADLCSGSGCIAITLEKETKNSQVFAIELSDDAFEFLEKNTKLNNSPIEIIKGNVLEESILDRIPVLDIIVSNPPYLTSEDIENLQKEVSFEPLMALKGGEDGLYFYKNIISLWKNKLKSGGFMFFEIGIGQENSVRDIFNENQFTEIELYKDLNGIIRVVSAKKI